MRRHLVHGGGIDAAATRFAVPRGRWLDLSTGINPRPYPPPAIAAEAWTRLPDDGLEAALRQAAAEAYGAPDPALVAAGPGSQALIQWLPRLRPAGTVALLGPTYGEHAAAWIAAGHRVCEVGGPDDPAAAAADVLVVVNPNNPDGRILSAEALSALAGRQAARGGWLVADEAFADVAPKVSLAAAAGRPGLVVLRSLGKFYGLAGARVGFALAEPSLAKTLRGALGPWAVAGPSAAAALAALADPAWREATRTRLAANARRLDGLLEGAGLTVAGGTSLFRLATHPRAADLFEHLGRAGILTRPFPFRPAWLRFGLPGTEDQWRRLAKALAGWDATR